MQEQEIKAVREFLEIITDKAIDIMDVVAELRDSIETRAVAGKGCDVPT